MRWLTFWCAVIMVVGAIQFIITPGFDLKWLLIFLIGQTLLYISWEIKE